MVSSTTEEDPFLQVQQDVLAQLASTRQLFGSYLRIRSLATDRAGPSSAPVPTPELTSARADLDSALQSLDEDVADLSEAVAAVEAEPGSFGLSSAEVARRRRTVDDVRRELDSMRSQLSSSSKKPPIGNDALPDPNSFALGDEDDDRGDDYYAELEQRQQTQIMREQDTQLDGVFRTVGNLRRQADDMGRELEEQSGMLDVVDEMADRVGGRLQVGMEKLKDVMRRNEDTMSSFCIALLIFVLILLLVLLLIL